LTFAKQQQLGFLLIEITAFSSRKLFLFLSFVKQLEIPLAIYLLLSKSVLFALIKTRTLPFSLSVAKTVLFHHSLDKIVSRSQTHQILMLDNTVA